MPDRFLLGQTTRAILSGKPACLHVDTVSDLSRVSLSNIPFFFDHLFT